MPSFYRLRNPRSDLFSAGSPIVVNFMYRLALLALLFAGVATDGMAADSNQISGETLRSYKELALPGHGLGDMHLSSIRAHFDNLRGNFLLRYDGILPADSASIFATSHIYKVLNADEIFALNKDVDGFCHQPPRW